MRGKRDHEGVVAGGFLETPDLDDVGARLHVGHEAEISGGAAVVVAGDFLAASGRQATHGVHVATCECREDTRTRHGDPESVHIVG